MGRGDSRVKVTSIPAAWECKERGRGAEPFWVPPALQPGPGAISCQPLTGLEGREGLPLQEHCRQNGATEFSWAGLGSQAPRRSWGGGEGPGLSPEAWVLSGILVFTQTGVGEMLDPETDGGMCPLHFHFSQKPSRKHLRSPRCITNVNKINSMKRGGGQCGHGIGGSQGSSTVEGRAWMSENGGGQS